MKALSIVPYYGGKARTTPLIAEMLDYGNTDIPRCNGLPSMYSKACTCSYLRLDIILPPDVVFQFSYIRGYFVYCPFLLDLFTPIWSGRTLFVLRQVVFKFLRRRTDHPSYSPTLLRSSARWTALADPAPGPAHLKCGLSWLRY